MAKKILIVEDDIETSSLYGKLLRDEGYLVETAQDGVEGLDKAKNGGFDLILLDIMMARMDGLQLLADLKAAPPKIPNGPIIILTNLSQDPVINKALSLGAKAFFIKSDLPPDQFLIKVKSFL